MSIDKIARATHAGYGTIHRILWDEGVPMRSQGGHYKCDVPQEPR